MTTTSTDTRVRPWGLAAAASGVLMTLLSFAVLLRDPSVPSTQWSYPQGTGTFLALSLLLTVAHTLSAAGYWGIRRSGAAPSRAGSVGLLLAVGGSLALSVRELASGLIAGRPTDSAVAGVVGTAFAVASLVFAVGAVIAGVVLLRRRAGLLGWLVLLTGVVIVVLVTPANVSGNPVFRQLSLLVWSLLYLPLGLRIARLRPL